MKDHITVVGSTAEGGSPQQGDRGSQKAGSGEKAKTQGDTETQAQAPREPLRPARLSDVSSYLPRFNTCRGKTPWQNDGREETCFGSQSQASVHQVGNLFACLLVCF